MNNTQTLPTNANAGFIGAQHADEVTEVFGKEMAEKMENAAPQETFLNLLFADFAN